jgi:glucosamine--fructose-6-phosphate aminotransferase (isomerizing)
MEYASEFRNCNMPFKNNELVFVVNQSKYIINTLAALKEAKRMKYPVMRITNVMRSTIAWTKNIGIFQHALVEIDVVSTKAYKS